MATNNRQNPGTDRHFADLEGRQSAAAAAPTRLSIKDKLFRLKKFGTDLQEQGDDENQFKVGGGLCFSIPKC